MAGSKPLVANQKEILNILNKLPKNKRNKLLPLLKKIQIDSISEVFKNFLNKKVSLNKRLIKKIAPYKRELKRVALKNVSLKEKLKILMSPRGGSLLGFILPAAVKLISKLFG